MSNYGWFVGVCIGVGIGGKDGPALFDLGVAACYGQTHGLEVKIPAGCGIFH
jgi:hypothetical protein